MYLKRLEMQGFKSFAKKADLSFNNNITIVVGPNGSGKSNIVDAVRWVLGEGSAKSLRGSKMEDVIFSGSTEKKPLGMAQVSLTLDNSSGIFPVDYSEVKITRKLFRSGESEYLINNVKCRQKDIHELVMDTGIGKDSFSIIGQGKVDQILLSQAEEKRALIEEVAGISKYRYRKSEAKRKLTDTENSLLRVKDILGELESQKEPLKEQAEKAKEYKEHKNQLDDLEIELANYTINSLEEKSEDLKQERGVLLKENLSRETLIIKEESKIQEISLNLENLSRETAQVQNKIYQKGNEINDFQNKTEFSEKMMITLKENLNKAENEKNKSENEIQELLLKEEEDNSLYQTLYAEYRKQYSEFKDEEERIYKIKNQESGLVQKIQLVKEELFDWAHQISEKRNEIIDLEKREAVIQSGVKNIENKINNNENFLNEKKKEKEKNVEELSSFNVLCKKTGEEINEHQEDLKQLLGKIKDKEDKREKLKRERESKSVNKTALEALENNKEGYSAGVKSVFANKSLKGIKGTVADLAETTSEYWLALETALGGSIQNIVTESETDAKNAIDYLRDNKAGRATFLPLNIINERTKNYKKDNKNSGLKSALDVVIYDKKFESIFIHLLGGIYIARDMDEALEYNRKQEKASRIVTLKGEIIDSRGSMTGGQYRNNQEGFLLRKENIKKLSLEIQALDKDMAILNKDGVALAEKVSKIQSDIFTLEEKKSSYNLSIQDFTNRIKQIDFQISETEKDNSLLNNENSNYEEEKTAILIEKERFALSLSELEKEKQDKEKLLIQLQIEAEDEKNNLFDMEKALGRMEIAFNDLKNKKETKEIQLSELKERIKSLQKKQEDLQIEEKGIQERIKNLSEDEGSCKEKIKDAEIILANLEKKAEALREIRDEQEKQKKSLEEEVRKNRKVFEETKEKIHSKEITLEKYKTEAGALKENLQERFNITYQRSIKEFSENFSERSSKQKVRELRKKIEDLGEVNLIAISEYEKLIERYTFLKTQCEDLDEAKDSLTKIIDEMDHIIAKKFKETFHKLNEAFKVTFGEMFNGGSAEIVMTDKDNILETGIEIIAQPPGKTPKHLSLLSGGEKAMTAICLLFAILKIKPGPFCILDEIEASLDESNVTRFAGFLKKFAQLTQFVVISHRKGTMEAGDVLYGVTMEERGVSSLISVRISETIKLSS